MYTFRAFLLFVEDKNGAQDMADYVTQLLEDVLEETIRKPHGTALALEPTHATSVSKAIATLDGEGAQQSMGQWVRKAMCLVPVQISRCGGTVQLGLSFSAVKVYVPQNQWYEHVLSLLAIRIELHVRRIAVLRVLAIFHSMLHS